MVIHTTPVRRPSDCRSKASRRFRSVPRIRLTERAERVEYSLAGGQ